MNILDRFEFRGDKMVHVKARINENSKFANYVPLDKILTEPKPSYYPDDYVFHWMIPDLTYTWWEDLPLSFKQEDYMYYNGREEKTCQPKTELLSRRELLQSPKHWGKLMSTVISSWKS